MSVNLGKTYKVIGTLYIIQNQPVEARDYLTRALSIFELKGNTKVQKEIKAKLKLLTQPSRTANLAMDFQDASEYESNAETQQIALPHKEKRRSAQKSVGPPKKRASGVKTNNYFD
jgi:hypothetical protein